MANNKKLKQRKRKVGYRGYRLHDERLARSGGSGSMRTIKYEVVDPQGVNGLRDEIAEAVISDCKSLYGNINLNDYLRWREKVSDKEVENGEREPSFLGFWVKALSLGFVFSNKIEYQFKNYLGQKTIQEKYFKLIPVELRDQLDKEKWCEWFLKPARPNSGTKNSLSKQITDLFLEENIVSKNKALEFLEACKRGNQNDLDFRKKLFDISDKSNIIVQVKDKIFWTCSPDFSEFPLLNWTADLDKIIDFWNNEVGINQAKIFLSIGENGNHFNNGILGKFFEIVCEGDLEKASEELQNIFNFTSSQKNIILNRFKKLRKYAKYLPKQPALVKNWSEYRSDFNGTIESWFSNRGEKQHMALGQLYSVPDKSTVNKNWSDENKNDDDIGIVCLLKEVEKALPKDNDIKEGILQETIEFLGDERKKIDREFSGQLESYLATLKSDLNEWSQNNSDLVEFLPKGWQKKLSKHIQLSPLFFGEVKRLQWEEIYNLKKLVKQNIAGLEEFLDISFEDYEITDKIIDSLAYFYNNIKKDGTKSIIRLLENIQTKLNLNFSDKNDHAKFHLSGYERGKYKQIEIKSRIKIGELLEIANLENLYNLVIENPQQGFLLRDVIGLSKVVLSSKLVNCPKDIQRKATLLHSNLQGYSSLISKLEFISRYSVQSANGEQSELAVIEDKTKKGAVVDRYAYVFSKFDSAKKVSLKKYIKKGNKNKPYVIKDNAKSCSALKVQSSKYQVQFLDWAFRNDNELVGQHKKHKNKKNLLNVAGAFTIAEKISKLNWQGENPVVADADKARLFVSQPFTLYKDKKDVSKYDFDIEEIKNRYIGVDIGEYGLAWSLISCGGKNIKLLEQGFIADNQQAVLKKDVSSWRKKQVLQTFTSANTKIAELRKSLIGSYQNQLDSLALKYNARLSFEYEVSNFEAGGNRIVKVYNGIKRGNILKPDNKEQNKQAWGERFVNDIWGFETKAAGTSQFCTKCKRWSSFAILDKQKYELEEYNDGLYKVKLSIYEFQEEISKNKKSKDNNKTAKIIIERREELKNEKSKNYVRLLLDKNKVIPQKKLDANEKVGSYIYGKDIRSMIYKVMRPNMEESEDDSKLGKGMQIVKSKLGDGAWQRVKQSFGKSKSRGNMAIFVCPYIDCQHIADADLQAAFNIAVRGYLKMQAHTRFKQKKDKNKRGKIPNGYLTKERLCYEQSKLVFDPVGF